MLIYRWLAGDNDCAINGEVGKRGMLRANRKAAKAISKPLSLLLFTVFHLNNGPHSVNTMMKLKLAVI